MYFLLDIAKYQCQFGQDIYMHLIGPFRKYYGLCSSELPLAKSQRLKIQDFGISFVDSAIFLIFIRNISRTVKSKGY